VEEAKSAASDASPFLAVRQSCSEIHSHPFAYLPPPRSIVHSREHLAHLYPRLGRPHFRLLRLRFGTRMDASMKVLHIVKTVVGATWAYRQVQALRTLGVEVAVALPSDTEGLAPRYREAGATVLRANLDLPVRHPWRLPGTLRACRELVEHVRPDLIHSRGHHVCPTTCSREAFFCPRVFGVTRILHLEHDFFAGLDTFLAGPRQGGLADYSCDLKWKFTTFPHLFGSSSLTLHSL
jgi:hypothetical protein